MSFIVNALCAFFLNMAVYLVIQTASGLIFALGGVLKDLIIIFGSAIFLGQVVTGTQVFGYLIALSGLQVYGIVSKDAVAFDQAGVLPLLRHRLDAWLWPNAWEELKGLDAESPGSIEMQEDVRREVSAQSLGNSSKVSVQSLGNPSKGVERGL